MNRMMHNVTRPVSTDPSLFIESVKPEVAFVSLKVLLVPCKFTFFKSQINKGATPTDCMCSQTGDFKTD